MKDDAIDVFLEEEDNFHSDRRIQDKESQKVVDKYHQPSIFGRNRESAIHIAIRGIATEAALCLIAHCSDESILNVQNGKGVTPLKVASRKGNLTVVKELLRRGADPAVPSFIGLTALSDACHFGHSAIVEDLLLYSNDSKREIRSNKTDAAYQLALLDHSSSTNTTALMRASRNGHANVVKILLHQYLNAAYEGSVSSCSSLLEVARNLLKLYIGRRNNAEMTALLLASQHGHAEICRLLIEYGSVCDDHGNEINGLIDASSNEETSLILACKREHLDVARVLAASGCELFRKDSRGRTAYDILSVKLMSYDSANWAPTANASINQKIVNIRDLISVLDPVVQVELMQKAVARSRNCEMLRFWHLLQTQRAYVIVDNEYSVPIHSVEDVLDGTHASVSRYGLPHNLRSQRKKALLRTMTLPLSLVQCIVQYIPVPLIWNRRLRVLNKRCFVNTIAATSCSLDLIDEVLELGGFVEACDIANDILPPNSSTFKSWKDWKTWRLNQQISRKHMNDVNVVNSDDGTEFNNALVVPLAEGHHNISVQLSTSSDSDAYRTDVVNRRTGEFMQQMAYRSKNLVSVLAGSPYNMDADLIQKLLTLSDIASVVRRMGIQTRSIHLEPSIGMDFMMLATRLCSWYWRERNLAS